MPAFIIIELRKKDALVDLRLFARRNFRFGSIINVILVLGSMACIYPSLHLGQTHGYDALQIAR